MARTETYTIPLNFPAPPFDLPDAVSGGSIPLEKAKGEKGMVVMFICNHCPFVIHVKDELVRIANDYMPKGIGFVAICSNDVNTHPADDFDKMKEFAQENDLPFPYLHDKDQSVAKAYHAACTPDFSVFDADLKCVYRGRMDGSTPGNDVPVTGTELRAALDALVAGTEIPNDQVPSVGCNIKWTPGNEPAYF